MRSVVPPDMGDMEIGIARDGGTIEEQFSFPEQNQITGRDVSARKWANSYARRISPGREVVCFCEKKRNKQPKHETLFLLEGFFIIRSICRGRERRIIRFLQIKQPQVERGSYNTGIS
jgi:hypothetical protein